MSGGWMVRKGRLAGLFYSSTFYEFWGAPAGNCRYCQGWERGGCGNSFSFESLIKKFRGVNLNLYRVIPPLAKGAKKDIVNKNLSKIFFAILARDKIT